MKEKKPAWSMRMGLDIKKMLISICKINGRSMSNQVIHLIKKEYEKICKKN